MAGLVADPAQLDAAGELAQSPELWNSTRKLPDPEQLTTDEHIKAWPYVSGFFQPQNYSTPTMQPLLDAGKGMAQQVLSQYSAGDPRTVDEVNKLAQREKLMDDGKINRSSLEHELLYQAVNDRIGHRMFDDPTSLSSAQHQELRRLFNFDSRGSAKFPFEVLDQGSSTKQPLFVPGNR